MDEEKDLAKQRINFHASTTSYARYSILRPSGEQLSVIGKL
jgi:hypothetical protein